MAAVSSILCPVDFSEGSRAALCYAAALADYFGARLTVITVDDPLLANAAAMGILDPPLAVQSEAELRRFSDDVLPHLAARATRCWTFASRPASRPPKSCARRTTHTQTSSSRFAWAKWSAEDVLWFDHRARPA